MRLDVFESTDEWFFSCVDGGGGWGGFNCSTKSSWPNAPADSCPLWDLWRWEGWPTCKRGRACGTARQVSINDEKTIIKTQAERRSGASSIPATRNQTAMYYCFTRAEQYPVQTLNRTQQTKGPLIFLTSGKYSSQRCVPVTMLQWQENTSLGLPSVCWSMARSHILQIEVVCWLFGTKEDSRIPEDHWSRCMREANEEEEAEYPKKTPSSEPKNLYHILL